MRAFDAPSGFWKRLSTVVVVGAAGIATRALMVDGDDPMHWMLVARDSSYSIALDTSRIVATPGRTYEVWYRTDHSTLRFYNEHAFTREIVHAVLRCDGYTFRVMSAVMSIGGGRPVVRQVTEPRALGREAWRRVEPGSTEADAARATCEVADWTKWRR